eukprot:9852223-Lingulodinium_polyedra.AAC.1
MAFPRGLQFLSEQSRKHCKLLFAAASACWDRYAAEVAKVQSPQDGTKAILQQRRAVRSGVR